MSHSGDVIEHEKNMGHPPHAHIITIDLTEVRSGRHSHETLFV